MTTQDIEITLPEDSIFKQLFSTHPETESKTVETGFTDEEYNKMMHEFLTKARISALPQTKIKEVIQKKADLRKPLKFRKGFLNTKAAEAHPRTSPKTSVG